MSAYEETYHRIYGALMRQYFFGFAVGLVTGAGAVATAWLASHG